MSKLSQTPPLRSVQLSQTVIQVSTHLKEPLLPKRPSRKIRQELYLIKQLGQLQLLLEKINRLELWKLKGGLKLNDSVLKKLYEDVFHIQMEIMTQQQQQEKSSLLLDVIKKEKTLYPGAIKLLFNEKDALPAEEQQQQQHEYDQLNHLDQLYVIACRLYHDLNLSNHKYIAYQLALLYQCINRQGVPFISYKSRIESRFDEIKSTTKKSDTVYLEKDQIAWLQSLTLDIIMQVTDSLSIMKCGQLFTVMRQVIIPAK